MTDKTAIRTRKGSLLRDPANYNIVTEGYLVDIKNPFWQRRLKAGDIEIIEPVKKKEKKVEEILVQEKPKKTRKKRGDK